MQLGAPAHQPGTVGLAPETRHQRAQQQLLHDAHARMRRHLECAQLEQAETTGGRVGRVQLVDAELAAMGVAGHVDQDVAQRAVHQPGRQVLAMHGLAPRDLAERDLQFVELVVARFVDARRLAGRADEQAREQITQARMVVPVGQQAGQQVGPTQERAVGRRRAAEHEVVAAAGAGVASVEHELLARQPRLPGRVVQELGVVDQLVPVVRRMDVDLDHPRVGRHLQHLQTRVARRRITFEHDLQPQLGGGGLDGGQQVEVVLQVLQRRHEDVERAAAAGASAGVDLLLRRTVGTRRVARLDHQRGARDPVRRFEALRCARGAALARRRRRCQPGRAGARRRARAAPPPGRPPARRRGSLQRHRAAFGEAAADRVRRVLAADRRRRRQRAARRKRIGLHLERKVLRRHPGQRIERQPVAHRRVARHQVHALVAEEPGAGDPGARRSGPDRVRA